MRWSPWCIFLRLGGWRWVKVYHTIPIPVKGAQMACTRLLSVYIHIYYMIIYVCIYIFVLSYYRKIIKSKWSINDLLGSTVVVLRLLLVVSFYYDIHAYMCVFMISCYSIIESVLRCCCSSNVIYVHMRSTTTIILICQCLLVPWTLPIMWQPEIHFCLVSTQKTMTQFAGCFVGYVSI